METITKYIYQVYLCKNFSKVAKGLYISQPSLSAMISAKEKELGFKIFDRSTKPISLTAEGEIYIEMLEEMMHSETLMHHRIKSLNKGAKRSLTLGSGCFTSYYLLPTACGFFSRKYPDVEIKFDLGNTDTPESFRKKFDNKEIDVLFSYSYNRQKYEGYPIFDEQLVIAMRRELVPSELLPFALTFDSLQNGTSSSEKILTDGAMFRDIPFILFAKDGNTERYMSDFLGHYSSSSYSVLNARHSGVHLNMMRAGLGAVMTSDYIIKVSSLQQEDILYFLPPAELSKRTLYAILRKDEMPDVIMSDFFDTVQEVATGKRGFDLYCK